MIFKDEGQFWLICVVTIVLHSFVPPDLLLTLNLEPSLISSADGQTGRPAPHPAAKPNLFHLEKCHRLISLVTDFLLDTWRIGRSHGLTTQWFYFFFGKDIVCTDLLSSRFNPTKEINFCVRFLSFMMDVKYVE